MTYTLFPPNLRQRYVASEKAWELAREGWDGVMMFFKEAIFISSLES